MDRVRRQTRSFQSMLAAKRSEQTPDEMQIEGYFAVFNKSAELWPGAFEEIDPAAFNNTLGEDIRALINHDTTLVLGRNKSGTLDLKVDSHGLWGRININPNDNDAINLYERAKRGDVDQCSFGFDILSEETDWRDDGTVKWKVTEIRLYEVSVCTFPAYEDTGVQARQSEYDGHFKRLRAAKKKKLRGRMKKLWH